MNRVYRIVWNASRQAWMVAAELIRGRTKSHVGRKKKITKMLGNSLLITTSLVFTGNAIAENYNWNTPNGEWSNGSNWDIGEAPDNTNPTSNYIYISNNGEATVTDTVFLGDNANLYVGQSINDGTGSLVIKDNGQLTVRNFFIGTNNPSEGRVLVTGENASLTLGGSVRRIGSTGSGTLTLNKGATLIAPTLTIAANATSTGVLNIGSAKGETAVAGGNFDVDSLVFGGGIGNGDGTLVFNHTDDNLQFRSEIVGQGKIELYSGTTRFTANNTLRYFAGEMNVHGGVLAIDAGDTLQLSSPAAVSHASYTQLADATLRLGVAGMESYGRLSVMGSATFAKDTGLDINVKGAPSLTNGGTLSSVISADLLDASSFTMTDNSELYDFVYDIDGNVVNLKIVTKGSDGDSESHSGNGVLNSVNSQGFTPGRGAARVLDGFVNSGITGTDIENVTTALGQLSTQQQVSNAVAQTLPLLVNGTTGLAANAMRGTNRVIQSRQASNRGLSSGDAFLTDKAFWLKPVGSWSRQQSRNGVSGYDAESYGFVGGIDGEVTPNSRLGFAVSYMKTDVDGKNTASGNRADIDAYQLIAYGSHDLTQFADVEVNWQADVGLNKNDSKRYIGFMNRLATADYDSYTAHVGAGIGKRFQLTEQSLIMPSLRADYAYIQDESYTEKGAGALSLDVDSIDAEELILMAQIEANHQWRDRTSLSTTLGVGYDLINDNNSLTASYTGGGAAFTTEGMDPSPWLARAGVAATISMTDMTELTASYDLEGREDFLNQTASVKMRWRF